MTVIRVAGPDRRIHEPGWLARAEEVHRQLRPQLEADYAAQIARIVAEGGEMAVLTVDESVVAVAVFRSFSNTFDGQRFYVDDLVTDASRRSTGAGRRMIEWLEIEARSRGCTGITLESGVQRGQAHRFYFREGFTIASYSFRKPLA
ncbi:MAG: GNAT family N-acetyltransferase [Burkholderiales bacterium]|nr:GNAT family N-acetyltransferase [Burkholderiales bacterium]